MDAQNNLFTFDKIVINPQLRCPFEIVFGEKRVLQIPKKTRGNFVFSFNNGKVKLHRVSQKKMKEIKDLNKLDERDEKGKRKYILSERTGKPVLNTANARYRNSKYLTAKNFVPAPETNNDSENERESIGTFISNNYNKPRDIDTKYFKTIRN